MKLKKAAIFSDIHFGRKNNAEEHNQDCLGFIKWFCGQVKADTEIDHIWFLGDWHEHRAAINAFTLQRSYQGAKLLNELNLPIMWLTGNHDYAFRNVRTTYTTEIFEPFENIRVINDIEVIDEIYNGVLAIPYLREDEYPIILDHKNVPVVMGHLELKGFRITGTGSVMEHGPEASLFFKKQKRVFSGHFHQRQSKGNVHFVGSPFPMDFSDANDSNRGMATYDFETDNLKYIDWPDCPKYIKATLSDVLDDPKKILVSNARVKIDVDSDITLEESNLIRERFQKKYGLREITLEESYSIDVNLSDEEEAIEELQLETTNEVIQELLRRIKDDSVDTDLLLKIYNSLAASAQDLNSKAASVEFLELTMQNYLSYGNDTTKVNLNFDEPTLILGRNYDSVVNGQIDSNGAGKSTILNGLLMCMFDKNLMGVDKNAQINKSNGKNMLLTVTFKVDGVYYKVERYRKNKPMGGDGVRLYKNAAEPVFEEEHDVTPDSVANCNAEIERILGIPYEMFIRIVVFSATHEPFLSLPSSHASKANQRDIIEELFGLTDLSLKAEKLKELLSASKSEFRNLSDVNTRLQAEHARHAEQVQVNMQRMKEWYGLRDERIAELERQLTELQAIDTHDSIDGFTKVEELTEQLNKVQKDIPVLESELRNIQNLENKSRQWEINTKKEIENVKEEIEKLKQLDFVLLRKSRDELIGLLDKNKTLNNEKAKLETARKTLLSDIDRLVKARDAKTKEVEHLADNQCPYCMQQFAEAKVKVQECQHAISNYDAELELKNTDLDSFNGEIGAITAEANTVHLQVVELQRMNIPENLDTLEAKLDNLCGELTRLKDVQNPYVADDEALTEDDINETLANIRKKVDDIQAKIRMAKEFINPAFKSMGDIKAHSVKIDSIKSRIDEIAAENNPFVSVVDSLQSQTLEELKTAKLNTLDKEIKHQDFLLKLLTKKDSFIRKALLNKSIPLLNTRLRANLDKIGLPHKVLFTEEMEVSISQFNANYEYGNFSAGQKARVNLCLAFAFRDVLQSRFGKINLCILDECLDTGLGNVGVTLAASMIKQIGLDNNLSMFIISHRDEVTNMFDKRLEIELRNGFSTILGDS